MERAEKPHSTLSSLILVTEAWISRCLCVLSLFLPPLAFLSILNLKTWVLTAIKNENSKYQSKPNESPDLFLSCCSAGMGRRTHISAAYFPRSCSVTEQCYSRLVPVPLRGEFRSEFLAGQKLHPAGKKWPHLQNEIESLCPVLQHSLQGGEWS